MTEVQVNQRYMTYTMTSSLNDNNNNILSISLLGKSKF